MGTALPPHGDRGVGEGTKQPSVHVDVWDSCPPSRAQACPAQYSVMCRREAPGLAPHRL